MAQQGLGAAWRIVMFSPSCPLCWHCQRRQRWPLPTTKIQALFKEGGLVWEQHHGARVALKHSSAALCMLHGDIIKCSVCKKTLTPLTSCVQQFFSHHIYEAPRNPHRPVIPGCTPLLRLPTFSLQERSTHRYPLLARWACSAQLISFLAQTIITMHCRSPLFRKRFGG